MTAALLFDLGSTVVQMDALKARSYALAAQDLDACLDYDAVTQVYEEVVDCSREEVANAILERFGLYEAASEQMALWNAEAPWQAFARLRCQYFEAILAAPDFLRKYRWSHVEALLEVAHIQECKVALTTMVCYDVMQRILAATSLEGAFDVLVARDDVTHSKPDPEIYHLTARLLEVPATACLVIESSHSGVQAALAAGMEVIALTTPFTRNALEAEHLIPASDIARDTQHVVELVAKRLHAMLGVA